MPIAHESKNHKKVASTQHQRSILKIKSVASMKMNCIQKI